MCGCCFEKAVSSIELADLNFFFEKMSGYSKNFEGGPPPMAAEQQRGRGGARNKNYRSFNQFSFYNGGGGGNNHFRSFNCYVANNGQGKFCRSVEEDYQYATSSWNCYNRPYHPNNGKPYRGKNNNAWIHGGKKKPTEWLNTKCEADESDATLSTADSKISVSSEQPGPAVLEASSAATPPPTKYADSSESGTQTEPTTPKNRQKQRNPAAPRYIPPHRRQKAQFGYPQKQREGTFGLLPVPTVSPGDTWNMGVGLPPAFALPQQPIHQRLKNLSMNVSKSPPAVSLASSYEAVVPGGLPVEKWFATKFCSHKTAFKVFNEEFQWLVGRGIPKPYPPFLEPKNRKRIVQAKEFTVNAHWVEGIGKGYITCEGPNPSSVYDFWEMVWQEKVGAILMLNQPYEERLYPKTYNSAHETIQYWPMVEGTEKTFAPWKIRCLRSELKLRLRDRELVSEESNNYIYRVSRISLVEGNPITNPTPREIIHVCYYRWPDGQIPMPPPDRPADYSATAEILTDILKVEMRYVKGPTVVHCHAGVGRTGVVIALDIAATRLLDRHFADVRETVRKIREQRPRAVMNVWQYSFINLALAELAIRQGLLPKSLDMGVGRKHAQLTCEKLVEECWRDMTEDFKKICCLDDGDDEEDFDEDDDIDDY